MAPLPSFGGRGEGETAPLSRLTPPAPPPLTGQGSLWDDREGRPYARHGTAQGSLWGGTGTVPYMKEGIGMEYTKADYIRFIGELLELLPVDYVKMIYSLVFGRSKRAGV